MNMKKLTILAALALTSLAVTAQSSGAPGNTPYTGAQTTSPTPSATTPAGNYDNMPATNAGPTGATAPDVSPSQPDKGPQKGSKHPKKMKHSKKASDANTPENDGMKTRQ